MRKSVFIGSPGVCSWGLFISASSEGLVRESRLVMAQLGEEERRLITGLCVQAKDNIGLASDFLPGRSYPQDQASLGPRNRITINRINIGRPERGDILQPDERPDQRRSLCPHHAGGQTTDLCPPVGDVTVRTGHYGFPHPLCPEYRSLPFGPVGEDLDPGRISPDRSGVYEAPRRGRVEEHGQGQVVAWGGEEAGDEYRREGEGGGVRWGWEAGRV